MAGRLVSVPSDLALGVAGLAVTPTSTVFRDGVKKKLRAEALASCYNAILMQTIVDTQTYPYFYHDYFLLKNDVPSPVISRLPEIPGGPDLNFGLLHQSGHYTVAVLKEGMPLTTARSSSVYERSMATEGPPCHQSALGFIPVPTACLEDGYRQDRFVSISTGELRFVHIFRKDDLFCDYGIKSQQCEDYVKTWSWRDGQRVEECEMKFADFWEGTSYSSSRLPKFVPSYPTVDPCNHNLVNFYLPTGQRFDGHVICVDLPSMEIKYCGKKKEQRRISSSRSPGRGKETALKTKHRRLEA
uniref:DUF1618 domain-containing protein n=1 Tax=Aegilops tauschii TaxID=37682 RepID=N1R434_AEGTA